MKQQFTVLGVRKFNDRVEGTHYDFTKLLVVMDMPSGPNARGQDAIQMPFGTSENFAQFSQVNFPAQFELDVNMTTKGYEVMSARPVAAAQKVA